MNKDTSRQEEGHSQCPTKCRLFVKKRFQKRNKYVVPFEAKMIRVYTLGVGHSLSFFFKEKCTTISFDLSFSLETRLQNVAIALGWVNAINKQS